MRPHSTAVEVWSRAAPVLRHAPGPTAAVALAVLLGYSYGIAVPGAGLDQGWQLALSLGRLQRLHWGLDLTFTYGPWGLVNSVSPLSGGVVLQALLAQLAVLALTCVGAWHLAVARGRWSALVLTILVAGQAGSLGYATTFGLAVVLLSICHLTGRVRPAGWLAGIGALAGFALLVKFNVGLTALAVAGLTSVLAARPMRATTLVAGGALAGAVGGWLVAGQPLGTAADWVRQSLDVASAYSSAMGHRPDDMPSLPAQWAALGAVATVVMLAVGVLATRALGRRVQVATAAVLLVTMASAYLASSTRLDAGHAQFLLVTTFVVGAPLAAAVSWPRVPWLPWVLVGGIAAAELAVGTAVVGHGWHLDGGPSGAVGPGPAPGQRAGNQLTGPGSRAGGAEGGAHDGVPGADPGVRAGGPEPERSGRHRAVARGGPGAGGRSRARWSRGRSGWSGPTTCTGRRCRCSRPTRRTRRCLTG